MPATTSGEIALLSRILVELKVNLWEYIRIIVPPKIFQGYKPYYWENLYKDTFRPLTSQHIGTVLLPHSSTGRSGFNLQLRTSKCYSSIQAPNQNPYSNPSRDPIEILV